VIRPLRRAHRILTAALVVLLPLLVAVALFARRPELMP
jgi:hypothetical protein